MNNKCKIILDKLVYPRSFCPEQFPQGLSVETSNSLQLINGYIDLEQTGDRLVFPSAVGSVKKSPRKQSKKKVKSIITI